MCCCCHTCTHTHTHKHTHAHTHTHTHTHTRTHTHTHNPPIPNPTHIYTLCICKCMRTQVHDKEEQIRLERSSIASGLSTPSSTVHPVNYSPRQMLGETKTKDTPPTSSCGRGVCACVCMCVWVCVCVCGMCVRKKGQLFCMFVCGVTPTHGTCLPVLTLVF